MNDRTSDTLTYSGAGTLMLVGVAEPSALLVMLSALATVLGLVMKAVELYQRRVDKRVEKLERLLAERDDWIKAAVLRHHEPNPNLERDQ